MGSDVEIGIVRAGCVGPGGEALYWLFSRKQLEFVVKEPEPVESGDVTKAAYLNMVLPVVSLEGYFGFSVFPPSRRLRYMVLREADEQGVVHRLMIHAQSSPRFFYLGDSFIPLENFTPPENGDHFHGAYKMGEGKVVIVPDIVSISLAFSRDNL